MRLERYPAAWALVTRRGRLLLIPSVGLRFALVWISADWTRARRLVSLVVLAASLGGCATAWVPSDVRAAEAECRAAMAPADAELEPLVAVDGTGVHLSFLREREALDDCMAARGWVR
jgi:hypothetical protein